MGTLRRTSSLDVKNATGIDCWASTEHIVEDLRACLRRYECEAGGNVSWSEFDRLQSKLQAGELNTNPSKHSTCSEYFDAATEDLVRKHDSLMFGMFGHNKWSAQVCCSG